MPLHRSLKTVYVADLTLAILTCVTIVPLVQMHDDGHNIGDVQIFIAVVKATALILTLMFLRRLLFYQRMKENSKRVYSCHMVLLVTTLLQDGASIVEREIATEQSVFLGWLIFQPLYVLWALELLYLVLSCWVCLSSRYWINYPGLTKRQVLQILKLKLLAPPPLQLPQINTNH